MLYQPVLAHHLLISMVLFAPYFTPPYNLF